MAMDIITKEKKEIRWVGLPTHSKQDLHKLEVRLVSKPIAVVRVGHLPPSHACIQL
jgi:hypothetical protein